MSTTSELQATASARDIRGPSPLVPIENEPPARLIVDPPLAEQLAHGKVYIQRQFGLSQRVGHQP